MPTDSPRLTLTLPPALLPELDDVKREKFLNGSRADVIRYLIELGLQKRKEIKAM